MIQEFSNEIKTVGPENMPVVNVVDYIVFSKND